VGAGVILVAGLVITVEAAFAVAQYLLTPRALRRQRSSSAVAT
jgi:hypothetical protein